MEKALNSCSDVQQNLEEEIFTSVEEWLGVKLQDDAKIYFDKAHIEPDFYNAEEKIVGEIFVHVGGLLEGQKRKVAQDVLKMLLLDKKHGCTYRKIFVVCDNVGMKFLTGDSWIAACIAEFGIEIKLIEISEERRAEVLNAQKRQYR